MIKKITIVRHGESAGNKDRAIYLSTLDSEVPLTEEGREQASDMCRKMDSLLINTNKGIYLNHDHNVKIFHSSYVRAEETCNIFINLVNKRFPKIISESTVTEDSLLREHEYPQDPICLNTVEEAVSRRDSKGSAKFYHRFSNGESYADVEQRVALFLNSLQNAGDSDHVFIFCHGHTQQLFLKRLLGLSVKEFHSLKYLHNCEYTTLDFNKNGCHSLNLSESNAGDQIFSLREINDLRASSKIKITP